MSKEAVSKRKRELAVWLREGLVKLGPTFIKIGQQFSTRVDVLSPEFVKELEKLQVTGSVRCKRVLLCRIGGWRKGVGGGGGMRGWGSKGSSVPGCF